MPNNTTNISSATTTVVKQGRGTLFTLVINKPIANSTVTIYDSATAEGAKIGTLTFPATLNQDIIAIEYEASFNNGLTIVTSGASDLTVVWE